MKSDHHDEIDSAAWSSSSLRHLKTLHTQKPRVDLRAARETLVENRPIPLQRVESNAIHSLFIEDIWRTVHQYINTHMPGIVEPRTAADIAAGDSAVLVPMTVDAFAQRCEAAGHYSMVVRQLDDCTKPIVFAMINEWQKTHFQRLAVCGVDELNFSDEVFMRFLRIQNEINSERLHELSETLVGTDPVELKTTLLRSFVFGAVAQGFVTAREIILGTLAVAPEVYQQQFGSPITSAQMAEIATNLKPLVLMLAADDLQSHVYIAHFLTLGEPIERLRLMDPDMFFIAKPRGKLTLEINEEVLQQAVVAQSENEPRTGCPALESIGSSGRNVVTELYEWYIDLAKRFYLPQLERLGRAY